MEQIKVHNKTINISKETIGHYKNYRASTELEPTLLKLYYTLLSSLANDNNIEDYNDVYVVLGDEDEDLFGLWLALDKKIQ